MRKVLATALVAIVVVFVIDSHAQFRLPKRIPHIPGLDRIPGLDKLMGKEPPVTTSLADALTEVAFLDDFNPGFAAPLGTAPRTDSDYRLRPGAYHYTAQTYCLHAGTYAPGRGEGYLYAPLQGQRAEIIRNILRHSLQHPDIQQHDIQVLIWSILARTKPGDMRPELQRVAAQLLTPKELFDLNGGALGVLPDSVKQKALEQAPEPLRKVLEAENRIRDLVTRANATFDDIERVAVLAGEPPVEPGDRTDLPRQRWSYHPAGYFVRFDPHGYPKTTVDVYVPEWFQITRDDAGRITRLADQYGDRIETTYAPARKSTAAGLRASEFASVRFIDGINGKTSAKWDHSGWLLSGTAGQGNEVAGETLRMTDVSSRVMLMKQRSAEFARILDKKRSGSLQQLLDLAAYYDAVRALAGKDTKVARYPELALRAWQAAFVQGGASRSVPSSSMASASAPSDDVSGGNIDFDPSGNVAVPGQTGRQRLSQSSRCAADCECDHEGICRDLNDVLNASKSPDASVRQLSQQLGKLKKDFCDDPSSSRHIEQMQKDLQTTGASENGLYRLKTALNDLKLQAGCGLPDHECPVTTGSVMMCPHGGIISCSPADSNRAMTPNGAQLKATDICTVAGCPFSIDGQPSPCTHVQWIPTGGSLSLDCHSIGIVIGANGVPQGPVTIINP